MNRRVSKILRKQAGQAGDLYDTKVTVTNQKRLDRNGWAEGTFKLQKRNDYKNNLKQLKRKYLTLNHHEKTAHNRAVSSND